jgi:hypothetical protein
MLMFLSRHIVLLTAAFFFVFFWVFLRVILAKIDFGVNPCRLFLESRSGKRLRSCHLPGSTKLKEIEKC